MLIPDANVLVNAGHQQAAEHQRAQKWLREALRGREAVGFAWIAVVAFLRLSTHRSVFERPLSSSLALGLVERWLTAPASVLADPSARHLALLAGLLAGAGAAGNLVNDAHLAALALEHDATVVSFDYDFQRFKGLRWQLPG